MPQRALNLNAAIGRRVAEIRHDHGATQDQMAQAARTAGLAWTRSVVAALETGGRQLELGETVLVPLALRVLTGQRYRLADLVPAGRVELAPGVEWRGEDVLRELAGEDVEVDMNALVGHHIRREYKRQLAGMAGDAEHKAAKALDVPIEDVVDAARRLWRKTLTAHRDDLVEAQVAEGAPSRTVQAVRGHVTRALMQELRGALEGGD